ncbi:hypothetical protein MAPG_05195 [Magnaporthiopsis poae ATCC 64411]|uniref:Uncharacterized protein n=1 Tax=Magnaporthiopsis poae (strain ATCC 64411 / 73-15) TaxID=644358 RepID=A0A0C4DYR9_MAGP6|nr:hypothetical protein MAPG_05195 [Magnaporthiopsis poae ATCC 64411]
MTKDRRRRQGFRPAYAVYQRARADGGLWGRIGLCARGSLLALHKFLYYLACPLIPGLILQAHLARREKSVAMDGQARAYSAYRM